MRYLLFFFIPCLLFSFQDPNQKKCVVAGRVTNAFTGEPLRKVNVHLSGAALGRPVVSVGTTLGAGAARGHSYGGISDAQGYFRFEGVEAGRYTLMGDHPGFLMTQYGAKGPNQASKPVILQPGQESTDLNLALIPQAVITGRVVDEDGDPVSRVSVQAMRQMWVQGKLRFTPQSSGVTDDTGEFRIGSLSPGKYIVAAQPMGRGRDEEPAIPGTPQLHEVATYFPSALNTENASAVSVAAGQTTSGTDIHIQRVRTFHIRGKIGGSTGRPGQEHLILSLSSKDQFGMGGAGQAVIQPDHSFELSNVAPGSYFLNVRDLQSGMLSMAGGQTVEVGSADVNDVAVTLVPPGTLHGRTLVEGGAAPPNFHPNINLMPAEMGVPMSQIKFADDGTFSAENVAAGKYYARVFGAPEGAYLKSIRWGQQEVLGKELDFSNGASGELDIVFQYGAAQVSGTLQLPQDTNQPSASDFTVVLAPPALNADGTGLLFRGADEKGSFTFKGVPPGRYLAFALTHPDFGQLQNPDILKQFTSKGTEVDLGEKDNKQIQLTPIPEDDAKRILEAQ